MCVCVCVRERESWCRCVSVCARARACCGGGGGVGVSVCRCLGVSVLMAGCECECACVRECVCACLCARARFTTTRIIRTTEEPSVTRVPILKPKVTKPALLHSDYHSQRGYSMDSGCQHTRTPPQTPSTGLPKSDIGSATPPLSHPTPTPPPSLPSLQSLHTRFKGSSAPSDR